jgi:hypothetical protein
MSATNNFDTAAFERVYASKALRPLRKMLLECGYFPSWDDQMEWVATAPEAEIVAWVKEHSEVPE